MRSRFARYPLLFLWVMGWTIRVAAEDGLDSLLNDNPFLPHQPPKPVQPESPPPYEFRGRSVENGIEYFSLYNLETKKAHWLSHAGGEGLEVKEYDAATGLVLAGRGGRIMRLALKQVSPSQNGGRPGAPLAALAAAPGVPLPATMPPLSEVQRVEQISAEIRARRIQRSQPMAPRG